VCGADGCAARARPIVADRPITLNDHALRLHFANANTGALADPSGPLLVFATGDGGMHRKDLDAYHHLVALGYPIVGFDARDYVTHLGHQEATTPAKLARDYEGIIDTARQVLRVSAAHPVVLVGVSRGAGLSVVAAGQRTLRNSIAGVVAVALTQEEEYVHWYRRLRGRGANQPSVIIDIYEYLPRLGNTPIAVIQSTRDNYLPAAAARALFGPDTAHRRFEAIDARNHSFGGARSELYEAMRTALAWVTHK
jgi:pimeloyl-ACP methyl ester carboxylesterase